MNILVVDDDPIARDLLRDLLAQEGFKHVETAETAEEAVAMLAAGKLRFDCLILDVDMPGMNGIELCQQVRELDEYTTVPILMVATAHRHHAIYDAFSAGASDFIMKPFNVTEIRERMHFAKFIDDPAQARQLALMRATHKMSRDPEFVGSQPVTALHVPQIAVANTATAPSSSKRKRWGLSTLLSNLGVIDR